MKLLSLRIIGILQLLYFIMACSVEDTPSKENNASEFNSFILQDKEGRAYHPFYSNDSTIHVIFPQDVDLTSIEVLINNEFGHVFVDNRETKNVIVDMSDFTNPIMVKTDETKALQKIIVYNLPVVSIWTPDSMPIKSKKVRTEGCQIKVYNTNGEFNDIGTAGVRGRGGSTWIISASKKPYNIKLDKKASIFGMPESKHWILLANPYYDRTQLHNATAFEVARLTDFQWVQSGTFVELILNGEHKGLYYLCEKIGAEKGKINVPKYKEGMADDECGYLLESYVNLVNNQDTSRVDFPFGFFQTGVFYKTGNKSSPCVLGWEIKEPDEKLSQNQVDYIKRSLRYMEQLLRDSIEKGKYRDLFDIESAINWWLVEEACLNEEASRTKNVYMYKSGGGKFCIGPPWDFDAWSFGLYPFEDNRSWSLNTSLYYKKLLKDPVFVKRLIEKWNQYYPVWREQIPSFIDSSYLLIHQSAERNERMFPDWHRLNEYPQTSYKDLVGKMKSNFVRQLELMDISIRHLEDNK